MKIILWKICIYAIFETDFYYIYKMYIISDLYKYEKRKIEKKSGKGVAQLYDFVATNICEYFLYNKGNHRNNCFNNISKKFIKKNNNDTSNKKIKFINKKNILVKFNILKIENNSVVCNK